MSMSLLAEFESKFNRLGNYPEKTIIFDITRFSEVHIGIANILANIIVARIIDPNTNLTFKLPIFYLIDSIMKHVGGPYAALFSRHLAEVYLRVFDELPEKDRARLDFLLSTWEERKLLSSELLSRMRSHINLRIVAPNLQTPQSNFSIPTNDNFPVSSFIPPTHAQHPSHHISLFKPSQSTSAQYITTVNDTNNCIDENLLLHHKYENDKKNKNMKRSWNETSWGSSGGGAAKGKEALQHQHGSFRGGNFSRGPPHGDMKNMMVGGVPILDEVVTMEMMRMLERSHGEMLRTVAKDGESPHATLDRVRVAHPAVYTKILQYVQSNLSRENNNTDFSHTGQFSQIGVPPMNSGANSSVSIQSIQSGREAGGAATGGRRDRKRGPQVWSSEIPTMLQLGQTAGVVPIHQTTQFNHIKEPVLRVEALPVKMDVLPVMTVSPSLNATHHRGAVDASVSIPTPAGAVGTQPTTTTTAAAQEYVNGFVSETPVIINVSLARMLLKKLQLFGSEKPEKGSFAKSPIGPAGCADLQRVSLRVSSQLALLLDGVHVPPSLPPLLLGPLPLEPSGRPLTSPDPFAAAAIKRPSPPFRAEDLGRDPAATVHRLYGDRIHQYSEDGVRFKTLKELALHTDAYLARKEAIRKKEAMGEKVYRSWYLPLSVWLGDTEAGDRLGLLGAVLGETAATDEVFVVPADEYFTRCPISREVFEPIWDNDEGEYMYRNAAKVYLTSGSDPSLYSLGRPTTGSRPDVVYIIVHKLLVLNGWLETGKADTLRRAKQRYMQTLSAGIGVGVGVGVGGVEGQGAAKAEVIKALTAAASADDEDEDDVFVLLELS